MKRGSIIGIVAIVIVISLVIYFYPSKEEPTPYIPKEPQGDCANAGEIAMNGATGEFKDCCTGLIEIDSIPYIPEEECEIILEGFGSICSDCGNNNCEEWENKCSCSADC